MTGAGNPASVPPAPVSGADFASLPLSGWFPGHMLKAGRQMQERLKLVDLVVELLDARIPATSRNPHFDAMFGDKPRFLLFNKADLADPHLSAAWIAWLHGQGRPGAFVAASNAQEVRPLVREWEHQVETARQARGATRPLQRHVRIMIAGMPNVGKSTLVNRLVDKKRAAVAPHPGVTRSQQWISLAGGVELLDTPGVMWPHIGDKETELKLGLAAMIRDEVLGHELLAEYLWYALRPFAAAANWDLYGLQDPPETPEALLAAVGKRRGLLKAGGRLDPDLCAKSLLKDFRDGRLGRFTLDTPPATA